MIRLPLCIALAACAKTPSEPARGPEPPALRERRGPVTTTPRERRGPLTATPRERRAPVTTTPRELFDDFTRPDADGLALLDKYQGGARFTATIKTVGVDEDGAPVVWIDVDGENVISLDFVAPAPGGLRAGAQLTVTCKIGGASGALMMVTSCTRS